MLIPAWDSPGHDAQERMSILNFRSVTTRPTETASFTPFSISIASKASVFSSATEMSNPPEVWTSLRMRRCIAGDGGR